MIAKPAGPKGGISKRLKNEGQNSHVPLRIENTTQPCSCPFSLFSNAVSHPRAPVSLLIAILRGFLPSFLEILPMTTNLAHEAAPGFNALTSAIYDMQKLTDHEQWEEVIQVFLHNRPTLAHSPCAHRILAQAFKHLGDQERCQAELATSCFLLEELLKTGNGTRTHPYQVRLLSDETDILRALKVKSLQDRTERRGGKVLHILMGDDGREIFFDVTIPSRWIRF